MPIASMGLEWDSGIETPDALVEAKRYRDEAKRVSGEMGAITYARQFDQEARKDYAFCRRYARGDSAFEVSVNLLGTYIDIMVSFLYARDPDVDALPADRIHADPIPEAPAAAALPGTLPGLGVDPAAPGLPGLQAPAAGISALIPGQAPPLTLAPAPAPTASKDDQDADTLKKYGRTMSIVIRRAWEDARMKRQAKRWLRAALTTGIGWLKSGWQETYQTDPVQAERIRDAQDNLATIQRLRDSIAEGTTEDLDTEIDRLTDEIAGLEGKQEKMIYRGMFIDLVPAEDIQVSLDVPNIVDCDSASWIAHRCMIPLEDGKNKFSRVPTEKWAKVTTYSAIKPTSVGERGKTPGAEVYEASDADSYTSGAAITGAVGDGIASSYGSTASDKTNRFIAVWEKWNCQDCMVYTMIEGLDCFAEEPGPANVATSRWHPFFPLALHEVDGERHPQSLVMRSYKLMDEYNRGRTGLAALRRRTKPRIAFDARNLAQEEVDKIINGGYAEWIPIKPVNEQGLAGAVWEVPYPKIDPALFDVTGIKNELEIIWGIQEALASGSLTPKTATEAEIQQAGTNARTGAMRDQLEAVMTDMARYHGEIAAQMYTLEDVRDIAGPGAIWIEGLTVEDMGILLNIDIRAGTTGKPNTTQQREQWTAEQPLIMDAIQIIGKLRNSSNLDIADCVEQVLIETCERAGDRIDVTRFIPKQGPALIPGLNAPLPGAPDGAPGGGPGATLPGGPEGEAPQGSTIAPTELPEALAA